MEEHNLQSGPFDPACAALVRKLANETRAKIVIHSSWRYTHSLKELKTLLSAYKVQGDQIIAALPEMSEERDGYIIVPPRGKEILLWLRAHPHVTHYVVLDDLDEIKPWVENHVLTQEEYGFTIIEYGKALAILNDLNNWNEPANNY
jgi:hypothetical protein